MEEEPYYVSIFCPLCGASFCPSKTKTNICLNCITGQGDITAGITKESILN